MEGEHKKIDTNSQEYPAVKNGKMKTRNLKIWTGVVAALIAMMNLVPMVSAAETADITVTVTVSYLSVSLNQSTVGFGTIRTGTNLTKSVNVTNDGNWPINLTLKQTYATNETQNWTIGTANIGDVGTDKYVMAGRFNTNISSVAGSEFRGEDMLNTSTRVANSTNFGSGNGLNVEASSSRNLWLFFNAPTSTTTKYQQTITVTVGAVAG